MVAIVYTNREPVADLQVLLDNMGMTGSPS